jgi:1-deoxy-D-xylulose-5-phosphate synthase
MLSGEILSNQKNLPPKYQDVGLTVLDLKKNKKIIGIPAMPSGSSLKFMMEAFPERRLM